MASSVYIEVQQGIGVQESVFKDTTICPMPEAFDEDFDDLRTSSDLTAELEAWSTFVTEEFMNVIALRKLVSTALLVLTTSRVKVNDFFLVAKLFSGNFLF